MKTEQQVSAWIEDYQHVNMIHTCFRLNDFHSFLFAQRPQYLSYIFL